MLHRVVFTPSGLEGKVADGTTVLEAARLLGADLDTVCGGRGICGRCQVTPSVGRFAKWGIEATTGALGDVAAIETDYRGNRPLAPGNRLGCAARVVGDVVVDVPASSQVHRQVVRKDLDLAPVVVDPAFSLYYVEVPAARLGDAVSASDALRAAFAEQHGIERPTLAVALLPSVHRLLAAEDGRVTVAVHRPGDARQGEAGCVVAGWPGYVDAAHGIAVDVGSTTVAGHLCDLGTGDVLATAGRMNPQIRFGEDLMSRVSYVMMNPGGDVELTRAIRRAIDELVGELVDAAGTARDRVLEVVLVGNPIMHHIVLGIDPTPLGMAPFVLATNEAVTGAAADLDLALANARFYVGPCIAGHVGADTAAAILAEGPHRGDATQLLVDVGTNAEIVLGDRHRQFAASSPTGPAFEGAQISCGQRATAGAIERVRIDPRTFEPRFRVIGCDSWSDDPGFDTAIAATGVTGVCGSGIIDAVAEMFLAGVIDADGTIRGDLAATSPRIVEDGRTFSYVLHDRAGTCLAITQNDVRAIQLAKAALRAGIDLLVEHAGGPDVADIRLAGAFGAHIDPVHALVLGLVPDCPVDGVRSVGNAAGAGAVQALLSSERRVEMEDAVRQVVKVETATEPRFQELFVAAMAFPHASAPSQHLATVVDLPERRPAAPSGGRRRRQSTERSAKGDGS
ncbi:MAG: ASKHA domain-containing protein [Actinomycetota bacterium]|nr:ASKHA domain-containing protein [Actinomycetota bacterium]